MKALMIGLGGIGQRHLRNLRAILGERLEVLAYRVRNQSEVLTDRLQIEPGSQLEEKYSLRVFHDLDEALAEKPDAAFICNPSSLHVSSALSAARSGCHLFIEKPLSHELAHVQEMIDLVKQKNLVCLVAYQMRFHPCLQRVHALLQENAIGPIVSVRAEVGEYLPGWHPYEDYRQMYASRRDLGGGVILSQIHEMDYLYWWFGLPKCVFTLGGKLSSLEIDVEDMASTLMDCAVNGRRFPVHLHQDYVQRPPSRGCQIIGDRGKIVMDLRALSVEVFDSTGNLVETQRFESFERNQLFLDEMTHFLDCVENGRQPLVNARDGAQSLRMALAARESLESGRVVEL